MTDETLKFTPDEQTRLAANSILKHFLHSQLRPNYSLDEFINRTDKDLHCIYPDLFHEDITLFNARCRELLGKPPKKSYLGKREKQPIRLNKQSYLKNKPVKPIRITY